jgi:large-conductance mechanosensitive channel
MSGLNNTNIISRDEFFSQLKKFIVDNGIIGTTAGVAIALVTNDLIKSLASDIIVPIFIILFLKLNIKSLTAILPGKSELDITNFFKQFISWILVVVITFFFLKTAFEGILGAKKEVPVKKESFFAR